MQTTSLQLIYYLKKIDGSIMDGVYVASREERCDYRPALYDEDALVGKAI